MSNRAVRRQQTKEPKGGRTAAPRSALPRTGTARTSTRAGGGPLSWRPRFVMDIVSELRKVVWPTRDDVVYLSIVVVIVAIIFGAVLGAIDLAFGRLIDATLLK